MVDYSPLMNMPQNALLAFRQGQEQRRQDDARKAMAEYASNPTDQGLNALAPYNPQFVLEQRQAQAKASDEQRRAQLEQLPVIGRLLDYAKQGPQQWEQALTQARRLGIDVSTVPQQYDPQWAEEQLAFTNAVTTPEGQQTLTEAGRYARELGITPEDPRYQGFITEFLKQKFAQPYTGAQGETRVRYPDFVAPQQGQPAPAQSPAIPSGNPLQPPVARPAQPTPPKPTGMTDDEIWAQAHEAVRNGANAEDVFRRLQAWGMNP